MARPKLIAIIGAGIAGLSAAKTLAEFGHSVAIFEKSRGLGGRLATKRVGDFAFDHGAQYFTVQKDSFKSIINDAIKAGYAAEWEANRFVGIPGMSSFARILLGQCDVHFGRTIQTIARKGDYWSLCDINGEQVDGFDAVILALPSPQIATILKNSSVKLDAIGALDYHPCWALMLAFNSGADFNAQTLTPDDPIIAWIAENSAKPNRATTHRTFVVHATPAWSVDHLEANAEDICKMLRSKFKEITEIKAEPTMVLAHRWRYARVIEPLGHAFVWDEKQCLGACGDWAIGSRIEDAFISGHMLAKTCFNER